MRDEPDQPSISEVYAKLWNESYKRMLQRFRRDLAAAIRSEMNKPDESHDLVL